MVKKDTLEIMKKIEMYFKKFADNGSSQWRINWETSNYINSSLENITLFEITEIQSLIDRINWTEKQDFFDGSGWLDYKLRFITLLRDNGVNVVQSKSNLKIVINTN
jgi:hypothetical protein